MKIFLVRVHFNKSYLEKFWPWEMLHLLTVPKSLWTRERNDTFWYTTKVALLDLRSTHKLFTIMIVKMLIILIFMLVLIPFYSLCITLQNYIFLKKLKDRKMQERHKKKFDGLVQVTTIYSHPITYWSIIQLILMILKDLR